MIVGLNLSHDSSAALLDTRGNVIFACTEERFTRKKHHLVFPRETLKHILTLTTPESISQVVIGSHSRFDFLDINFVNWLFRENEYHNFNGKNGYSYPPGILNERRSIGISSKHPISVGEYFKNRINGELKNLGIQSPIDFVNHHSGHAASAMVASNFTRGLAISLDGEGDGESGVIWQFKKGHNHEYQVNVLQTFKSNVSLGRFYSQVTDRYNFKSNSHEGKITGLAAYGAPSPALDYLMKIIKIEKGKIIYPWPSNKFMKKFREVLYQVTKSRKTISSIRDAIEVAADKSVNYADLAFAAQRVLEDKVSQLVNFYTLQTGEKNIALAGGLFANVKLNQKILELPQIKNIFIFPEMGDSGLSIGGVWQSLNSKKKLHLENTFSDVYLGPLAEPDAKLEKYLALDGNLETITQRIAKDLSDGLVIGVVQGRMEFGPRALLNRSILADPRESQLNRTLNKRLNRTEFMPFAPVCLEKNFERIFEVSNIEDWRPFEFMTLTCGVREQWKNKIPAVVHVDGTARPQILRDKRNVIMEEVLLNFEALTGIPCLVNTSFNIHEEPIVMNEYEARMALEKGVIDCLLVDMQYYKINGLE